MFRNGSAYRRVPFCGMSAVEELRILLKKHKFIVNDAKQKKIIKNSNIYP
jgi:hypothetical protein